MKRMGLARGLLALLLLPGISLALGLGDVHLNSPLNAPLDAEIELVNATPEDLATLDAKLASKETFARYGLDWPPFMSGDHRDARSLRERRAGPAHQVDRDRHRAVPDAAHRSVVGAWPSGARIHRAARSAGVRARTACARAGRDARRRAAPPLRPDLASRADRAAEPPRRWPAGGGDSYEVQRGDSLSAIARRLSASTGARTDQLMVSIYRGNAGAFEGDMNRLRAGSVLRIPSGDEIAAVSPTEASGEVRRLAGAWAASSGASAAVAVCAWCRRATRPRVPAASAADAAEIDALQDRVRDLEGQLTESKRMLELRNTELADLQAKLAASQQQPRPLQPAPTERSGRAPRHCPKP